MNGAILDPAAATWVSRRNAAVERRPALDVNAGAGRRLAAVFLSTSFRYVVTILPAVTRELSYWRKRAHEISDATLRRAALAALDKRGNMEGAALFAVLAPPTRCNEAVRALVAFQAAYNYLDLLAEQPSQDPVRNGRTLHRALLDALDSNDSRCDYYADNAHRRDCGYLVEMIETSSTVLAALPSYARVRAPALAAAARIVEFQSLNLGQRAGSHDLLARWARSQGVPEEALRWWEVAAAAGSSLAVHAMIALAARPSLDARELDAVTSAYHPWIGALHSLLDSLIDVDEDRREGQRNLLGHYASVDEASVRVAALADRACAEAHSLAAGDRHEAIVVAMIAHYLSAPSARRPEVLRVASATADCSGPLVARVLPLFRAARVASRTVRRLHR